MTQLRGEVALVKARAEAWVGVSQRVWPRRLQFREEMHRRGPGDWMFSRPGRPIGPWTLVI